MCLLSCFQHPSKYVKKKQNLPSKLNILNGDFELKSHQNLKNYHIKSKRKAKHCHSKRKKENYRKTCKAKPSRDLITFGQSKRKQENDLATKGFQRNINNSNYRRFLKDFKKLEITNDKKKYDLRSTPDSKKSPSYKGFSNAGLCDKMSLKSITTKSSHSGESSLGNLSICSPKTEEGSIGDILQLLDHDFEIEAENFIRSEFSCKNNAINQNENNENSDFCSFHETNCQNNCCDFFYNLSLTECNCKSEFLEF